MGVEFFQTPMGRKFYEGTMPSLVDAIEKLNENMALMQKQMEEQKLAGQFAKSNAPSVENTDINAYMDKIHKAEEILIENGVEKDFAPTVLQSIGYILLDKELYIENRHPTDKELDEIIEKNSDDYER